MVLDPRTFALHFLDAFQPFLDLSFVPLDLDLPKLGRQRHVIIPEQARLGNRHRKRLVQ